MQIASLINIDIIFPLPQYEMAMASVFSKIIKKEIPSDIVYEDEKCLAFKDIRAQAPVHILLIPKREIPSMACLTEEDQELAGYLFVKAAAIAKAQGLEGYRLVVNTNEDGGQTVYHLHLHILGGRRMSWPPG